MHLSRWGDGGGECAPATCTTGCFRRGRGLEEGERGEGEGAGGVTSFVMGGGLVDVGEEGVIQAPPISRVGVPMREAEQLKH